MIQDDVNSSNKPVNYQVLIPQGQFGAFKEEELSFFDLIFILWKKKFWLIGLTGIITLISGFYAMSMGHVYESTAYILAPYEKDIESLNLFNNDAGRGGAAGEKSFTIDKVYGTFKTNIKSRELKWVYFNQNNIIQYFSKESDNPVRPRDVFESFNSSLDIKEKDKELRVTFSYDKKEPVARILNNYIEFINTMTVNALLADVRGAAQFEKEKIQQLISQQRRDASLRRMDTIQQLKEQIQIARQLNIHTSKSTEGYRRTVGGDELPPHYLEGTKPYRPG